ncbi:MAG TPA: hypothetical protein VLF62_00670, partial [Candidatus Saccharimonadales bacterium]|nr:hypothetical protein [Candidatus Saccharimonadales bacterium]
MSDYDVPAFIKYGPNYEPSPQDVLRKAYMRNVVAPLAHVVFAAAVDAGGSGFYETLHEQEGEHIRQVATIEGASEHPVPLILGMSVDKSFQTYAERRMPDVVGVLTDPQRVALHRFFTGGSARDPNKSLLAEASTIMNATGNIVFRHPELGYNGDVTKLVGFWRHKRT